MIALLRSNALMKINRKRVSVAVWFEFYLDPLERTSGTTHKLNTIRHAKEICLGLAESAVFRDFGGQNLVFLGNQGDHCVERIESYLEPPTRASGTAHRRILPGKTRILPRKYPTLR